MVANFVVIALVLLAVKAVDDTGRLLQSVEDRCSGFTVPAVSDCGNAPAQTCLKEVILGMLPDANGDMCPGMGIEKVDVPIFPVLYDWMKKFFDDNLRNMTASEILKESDACSQVAGLSNSDEYCVVSASLEPLFHENVLMGLEMAGVSLAVNGPCVVMHPSYRTLGIAFQSGFEMRMGVSVVAVLGMTLSYKNCLDFTDLDGNRLMSAHASIKTRLALQLGIAEFFEVSSEVSTEVALDLDSDGDGTFATPGAVLRSLITQSCPYEERGLFARQAMDWQLGVKASMSMAISLFDGMIKYSSTASDSLLQVGSSASRKFISAEIRLSGPQSLGQMLGSDELESLLKLRQTTGTSVAEFMCQQFEMSNVSKALNPLCVDKFEYWGTEMTAWGTMSSPEGGKTSAKLEVVFGMHRMSLERRDSGYEFCVDDTNCNSFCFADTDCGSGLHCCHSSGQFTCQPVWTACCDFHGFTLGSCLSNGEINADSDACPNGYFEDKLTCSNANTHCKDLNSARLFESFCASNDTVGTCSFLGCNQGRGWTTCVEGECRCEKGCPDNKDGKCVDKNGDTAFEGTVNCFKQPTTTSISSGTCQSKSLAGGAALRVRSLEVVVPVNVTEVVVVKTEKVEAAVPAGMPSGAWPAQSAREDDVEENGAAGLAGPLAHLAWLVLLRGLLASSCE